MIQGRETRKKKKTEKNATFHWSASIPMRRDYGICELLLFLESRRRGRVTSAVRTGEGKARAARQVGSRIGRAYKIINLWSFCNTFWCGAAAAVWVHTARKEEIHIYLERER